MTEGRNSEPTAHRFHFAATERSGAEVVPKKQGRGRASILLTPVLQGRPISQSSCRQVLSRGPGTTGEWVPALIRAAGTFPMETHGRL